MRKEVVRLNFKALASPRAGPAEAIEGDLATSSFKLRVIVIVSL